MVQKGRIRKAAPQQRVTVRCPVKHCGESLNVTWCKLLEHKCEQISETENVEITQDDEYAADKLTSMLTFKRISIHDDGLYRCHLLRDVQISHFINISVSDLHQGTEYSDYYAGILSFNHNKGKETSTHMIPDLPKDSNHSTVFLQSHFPHLKDIPSPTAVGPSQPPVTTCRDQSAVAVDALPSCDVGVMVRRGTTKTAVAQQRLTVECPVKHCGESANVTWCKLLEHKCEQLNQTENVEITQDDEYAADKLTSMLTFKRISIHDDGLYRCGFLREIGHPINISVSAEVPSDAGKETVPWLPYFSICISVFLLVVTVSVLTTLSFYGFRRKDMIKYITFDI
ncbi:hypothetical protein GBF38_017018 [Nibea albiflora]|uniref:Uncharacterized protein n=1 Tax=Nibea albiflora TaxID=240163 RepID=A0ACB7EFT1_NIBAL|nr:hypothetical protein GBF38_017018 [Nibea albiflora]